MYPSEEDFKKVTQPFPYYCIAPASVWFTKQFPKEKWIELIKELPKDKLVLLLGAKSDNTLCEIIKKAVNKSNVLNYAGKLSFLESAALMQKAEMNFVNDSAPLHFASAVDAPVTAIFCSTVPEFGFTAVSSDAKVIQTDEKLSCRPCGLHGFNTCPKKHFKCAEIPISKILR